MGDDVAEFLASQPPISVPDAALPDQTRVSEPAEDALAAYNAERVARDDLTKVGCEGKGRDILVVPVGVAVVEHSRHDRR